MTGVPIDYLKDIGAEPIKPNEIKIGWKYFEIESRVHKSVEEAKKFALEIIRKINEGERTLIASSYYHNLDKYGKNHGSPELHDLERLFKWDIKVEWKTFEAREGWKIALHGDIAIVFQYYYFASASYSAYTNDTQIFEIELK